MLSKKFVFVLKISPDAVVGYKIDPTDLKVLARVSEPHTQDNLVWALEQVQAVFETRTFRLLIPPEKGFLKLNKINLLQSVKRQVEEQLSVELSEALSSYVYDTRQTSDEDEEGNAYYQVMVVNKQYLKELRAIFERLKLQIEAIELPTFALARITRKVEVPHLIFWQEDETRLVFSSFQGEVLESRQLTTRHKAENALQEVIGLTQKNFELEIKHAFLTPGLASEMVSLADQLKIKEEELLSPALGLALKTDIRGEDLDVLNITFPQIEKEKKESWLKKLPLKKVAIGLGLLAFLGSAGFWVSQGEHRDFLSRFTSRDLAAPSPTPLIEPAGPPAPTPTLTPTPTPLNKQELNIQVLNGSGQAGQAAEVKQFLESRGWQVSAMGNAARYDYSVTEVRAKSEKRAFLEELKKDLQEKFTVEIQAEDLSEDALFDAQIILGKN